MMKRLLELALGVVVVAVIVLGIVNWSWWMVDRDTARHDKFCQSLHAKRIEGPQGEGSFICVRGDTVVWP